MKKIGKIITNGVELEKHEYATILFLANRGFDIELIPQSYTKNQHTPDLLISGVAWEIKSPLGRSRKTIERNFKRALKQSPNIIIDLRRIKIPSEDCLKFLKQQFQLRRSIRKLKVITKDKNLLDFTKK